VGFRHLHKKQAEKSIRTTAMAAVCDMIDLEPSTAEYKSIRAADRARSLNKKRSTYELTQSLAQQRATSAAPTSHSGAHGHRAARVVARTCLAKGLLQTSADMPSLSLGPRGAGPTGCKKTTVANLINFQSEWHNTDVNNVDVTPADLSALMNKGLQDWIDADATTTEGSDGNQSDRLDSVASTPFTTPQLAPTKEEPRSDDHDELTPLPSQALDTDASPVAAVDECTTPQAASATEPKQTDSRARHKGRSQVKEALEMERKKAAQFRKQRNQEAHAKALAEKADLRLQKAKEVQEKAEAEALEMKAKHLAEATVLAEEQAEAHRQAVQAEAQAFYENSMEKLAEAEASMREQLRAEAEAVRVKARDEFEAEKARLEAELQKMRRRAETEALVIKCRAEQDAKEVLQHAEAQMRQKEQAEAHQAVQTVMHKKAKETARQEASLALKQAKAAAANRAKSFRKEQAKERREAEMREKEIAEIRAQADAEGRAAWAKAISEAEAVKAKAEAMKAKAAEHARQLEEKMKEQSRMMAEAEKAELLRRSQAAVASQALADEKRHVPTATKVAAADIDVSSEEEDEDLEDDIRSEPDADCSGGWELVSTHKEAAPGAEGEWHVIG